MLVSCADADKHAVSKVDMRLTTIMYPSHGTNQLHPTLQCSSRAQSDLRLVFTSEIIKSQLFSKASDSTTENPSSSK
jgi:hypothetical protein